MKGELIMAGEGLRLTGYCYCSCGNEVGSRSLFSQGHDRKAESFLIKKKYGGVAQFLIAEGYGPGGKNLHEEMEREG